MGNTRNNFFRERRHWDTAATVITTPLTMYAKDHSDTQMLFSLVIACTVGLPITVLMFPVTFLGGMTIGIAGEGVARTLACTSAAVDEIKEKTASFKR